MGTLPNMDRYPEDKDDFHEIYKMEEEDEDEDEEEEKPLKRLEKLFEWQKKLAELVEVECRKLKKPKEKRPAITKLKRKETLMVTEKKVRNWPNELPFPWEDKEQEPPTHPPSLEERYIMPSILGFKFRPNDEEIFSYLRMKSSNPPQSPSWNPIKDCDDFYGKEPWNLPGADSIEEMKELYFYVLTKKKSGNGNRTGTNGFWRALSSKILFETGSHIGYRRTLKYFVFPNDENHKSSKNGKPTNWMMHEYRLATTSSQSQEESFEHWTICKITWTENNIKRNNDFSRERSTGPSKMELQQNSSSLTQKYLDNNDPNMHIQNEGDLKVSKIVDSKQDETALATYQHVVDEFEEWTQEQRGKFKKQRINREIHQSDKATPCYAPGIHSTARIMVPTHEVETRGVEPQQFENPGIITKEFGSTSIQGQTSASSGSWPLDPLLSGWKDDSQSWFDPSISEHTSASSVAGFPNRDFIGREDENQSRFDPSNSKQISPSLDNWCSNLFRDFNW